MVVSENDNFVLTSTKMAVSPKDFDAIYGLSEDKMLEAIINKELDKLGMSDNLSGVPDYIIRRKEIMNFIFSVLIFLCISSIFFHLPIKTYIFEALIMFVYFLIYIFCTKFNFMKYLIKQVKENSKEKISNVVMFAKNNINLKYNNSKVWLYIIIPIFLAMIIFLKPHIFYEETDEGYEVRFYTFGLLNFKTAEIPEYHSGKKVVTLRGNIFSDMPLLETVTLPDSITTIRGQAFKNCVSLKNITLPKNLKYLGGGAFYNAMSLKSIELPKTLEYLGGESFYGDSSLESINIPESLTEIRGDTFRNCDSLRKIVIPDTIVRIGGHAFHGDYNLSEVIFGENSKLEEIGGGAFTNATSLRSIELPKTLTALGGESFYGASSLESIILPDNLTEIRGDTFEYCTSLKKIVIPDNVTRIGGHAFYGDYNLSEVIIGKNSHLKEIGSSAFRQCSSLKNISIPYSVSVNERAFKESPTSISRF